MGRRKRSRRKGHGQRHSRREHRAFYEHRLAEGETGVSGDGQEDADEAELRRRLREVLYRQPDDTGLLLRSSRVILRGTKGRGSEELAAQMKAVLESLGDQLLPGEGG